MVQSSYSIRPAIDALVVGLPGAAANPTHAIVTFRTPVDAATAKAIVRRAGALPHAVTVRRGSVTGEYRLGTELAGMGLIDDAVAWAAKSRTDPATIRVLAAQMVDTYSAYDLFSDGLKRENAQSLLALAENSERGGPPMISSIAFAGSPAVQRVLAVLPQVASVTPQVTIRGRTGPAQTRDPASASAIPAGIAALAPADLHRRLVAVAGRDIPVARIEGDWRLVRVDTYDVPDDTLRLSFRDGAVTGTLACRPVAGRYAFAGQTLTISAQAGARRMPQARQGLARRRVLAGPGVYRAPGRTRHAARQRQRHLPLRTSVERVLAG